MEHHSIVEPESLEHAPTRVVVCVQVGCDDPVVEQQELHRLPVGPLRGEPETVEVVPHLEGAKRDRLAEPDCGQGGLDVVTPTFRAAELPPQQGLDVPNLSAILQSEEDVAGRAGEAGQLHQYASTPSSFS